MDYGMRKEKIVMIRGRQYKLEAIWHANAERYFWNAYRRGEYSAQWEKIPCWTRSEEHKFPKLVARAANDWVSELNHSLVRQAVKSARLSA